MIEMAGSAEVSLRCRFMSMTENGHSLPRQPLAKKSDRGIVINSVKKQADCEKEEIA